MRLKLKNKQYDITWKHTRNSCERVLSDNKGKKKIVTILLGGRTHCFISEKVGEGNKDWEFVTEGIAWCHDSDMFVKDVGRRKSLARAIARYNLENRGNEFDPIDRKCIWQNYLERED